MEFEKISDLFIELIEECFAYIVAIAFVVFIFYPVSFLKWVFSLFKRIYLKIKEVKFLM
jgi:hypothetical protein